MALHDLTVSERWKQMARMFPLLLDPQGSRCCYSAITAVSHGGQNGKCLGFLLAPAATMGGECLQDWSVEDLSSSLGV